jgi:hypothetical protein
MRKEREALLVAALAGLVIVSVAAFVVQPSIASKSDPAIRVGAIAAPAIPIVTSRLG